MKIRNAKIITLIMSTFLVVGCGGDGKKGEISLDSLMVTVPDNISPRAEVSQESIEVVQGKTIRVDATGSSDEDGNIVSYSWQLADGTVISEAKVLEYNTASLKAGTYKIRLVVMDDDGATDVKEIRLTINEKPKAHANKYPKVNAGKDKSVTVGKSVDITGTASDTDGKLVYYHWLEQGKLISDRLHFSYKATKVGKHTLTLWVKDDKGAKSSDSMVVTVKEKSKPQPEPSPSPSTSPEPSPEPSPSPSPSPSPEPSPSPSPSPSPTPPATITHNGTTYGFVTSPYTGKVWLDRNLGAARVCEQFDDSACYGDYYQWGRNFDGHQDSGSGTTNIKETNVEESSNKFYLGYYWFDGSPSVLSKNWKKIDGSSICPFGFRVPTASEFQVEHLQVRSSNISKDMFNSFLNIPTAGSRIFDDGRMVSSDYNTPSIGSLWTTEYGDGSVLVSLPKYFMFVDDDDFDEGYSSFKGDVPAYGRTVRCIKN